MTKAALTPLEFLRADFRAMHYEDCSASKLLACNGNLLVRKSALPPEKFRQLKSRMDPIRSGAPHKVLAQALRETDPGGHELHVEKLIARPEPKTRPAADMVAQLTDGKGFRCWVNARWLRWLTRWVDYQKLTCAGESQAICLLKGQQIQALVMPLHPKYFEEKSDEKGGGE